MLSSCKPEVPEPNTYTVSFNANGGTGEMKNVTADEGSEITLTANAFTRMGYTFAEWNTKVDGSGEKIADKAEIKLTANVTLYAQWTANTYTVTFDKNADDATGTMESQTFTYGTQQVLNENKFTRTGYDFVGWATRADGEIAYNDKQNYLIGAENVTLYAKWTEKDKVAKVTFSQAGGEIDSGDTVTLSCTTEGATIYYVLVSGTQTPDLSKKEEYKAPITITDDITIAAVAVKDGMNQSDEVTATFTVKTYTVTFSTAHGTVPKQITGLKKGSKLTSEQLPTLSATGYTFVGWYNEETQFTTEFEISADVTLTAQWTANTYTVKFDKNADDATGTMESQTFTYGTSQALNENKFTRTGYNFAGWATRADGEVTYNDKQNYSIGAENVTLYAKWKAIAYSITYELNGGTNADGNPTSYTIETVTVTLKEPTKDGFTFLGWYEAEDFSGNTVTGWKAGEKTENVTLYAKWTANTYMVKFDANDATGTMESQTFTYGTSQALNENKFTRTGYDFAGWATSADGEVTYNDKQDYSIGTEDVTLYAKWLVADKFIKVPGVAIDGNKSDEWNPESKIFVSGRSFDIAAFYISDHEVTQAEWKDVMNSLPDEMAPSDGFADNNPVSGVSWYDAIAYCNKRSINEGLAPCYTINSSTNPDEWGQSPTSFNDDTWNDSVTCDWTANGYRLPTEAEWEWAARGGDDNTTYAGSNDIDEVAWYGGNSGSKTHEVKKKKPNGYGLYDMSGNVNEHCWDKRSSQESTTSKTPTTGEEGTGLEFWVRSCRGGNWFFYNIDGIAQPLSQYLVDTYSNNKYEGFRLARNAED